jgi:type IV secretory pathway VirB2 component (pilin)
MLSNLGSILQQLATALTSGTIPLSLATIAIAATGALWLFGRISGVHAFSVILGCALIGAASTLASTLVSG